MTHRSRRLLKPSGERGIGLSKQRIALHRSRLGFRLLGVILLAILLAIGVGVGIFTLGNHAVNSALFNRLFNEMYIDDMLDTFQEYVDANMC